MNGQPFQPFRLHMSNGKTYDIANHDAAFVKRNAVEIGIDLDNEGFASRFVECSILRIATIENLQLA